VRTRAVPLIAAGDELESCIAIEWGAPALECMSVCTRWRLAGPSTRSVNTNAQARARSKRLLETFQHRDVAQWPWRFVGENDPPGRTAPQGTDMAADVAGEQASHERARRRESQPTQNGRSVRAVP